MRPSARPNHAAARERSRGCPVAELSGGWSPATLGGILLLVSLLAAGVVLVAIRSAAPPAARAGEEIWREWEAALREQLRRDPGDERARVRLAGVLIAQAQREAQRAYPTERAVSDAEVAVLEAASVAAVQRSPRLAEAYRLVEAGLHGRDRRQRAAAWVRLARLHRLVGDPAGALACTKAAVREDSAWRDALVTLTEPAR